jgi:hypothetical protein
MSFLSNALNLIKGDLEIDGLPLVIGALQVLQKSPNAQGALAAEAYLLGNAPAALISAETQLLQQGISDLSAKLSAIEAAQNGVASAPSTTATLAKK